MSRYDSFYGYTDTAEYLNDIIKAYRKEKVKNDQMFVPLTAHVYFGENDCRCIVLMGKLSEDCDKVIEKLREIPEEKRSIKAVSLFAYDIYESEVYVSI